MYLPNLKLHSFSAEQGWFFVDSVMILFFPGILWDKSFSSRGYMIFNPNVKTKNKFSCSFVWQAKDITRTRVFGVVFPLLKWENWHSSSFQKHFSVRWKYRSRLLQDSIRFHTIWQPFHDLQVIVRICICRYQSWFKINQRWISPVQRWKPNVS